jgi:16S rRNA (cytosine967-C5)-methyltransferase
MSGPEPRGTEGLAERRAALQLLDGVLRRGVTLESAAQRTAAEHRPLALAIAGETLRRLPELDAMIDSATRLRLADDAKARMVLRLALAQKLAMNVPDHALVATALPLVDGGPRRLVHGVLGTLLRRQPTATDAPALPEPVEERWTAAWGEDTVAAARRAIVRRPPLDLSFAGDGDAQAFASDHGGLSLAPHHVRLTGGAAVQDLPGYGAGGWWVQDLAASLPARLIPRDATNVLDLCAAPGGKTMQLASRGHRVTAVDRSESRLARLSENLRRTGLDAVTAASEAMAWSQGDYDAVLLDAPCSATGTFRRHPEVLYRASSKIIAESAVRQATLLAHAASLLRPGGILVYAVCSLEPEEGEAIVTAAPDTLILDPVRADELPAGISAHERGWVRVLPGLLESDGGVDGFFIARLVRR